MMLHDNQLLRILANSSPAEPTGPGSGDTPRRHFLHAATAATVAVCVGYAAYPFLSSLRPSARAQARGGPVQGDLTQIEPGQLITVVGRGKTVWILHRTAEMRQRLSDSEWLTHLSDRLSLVRMQQPVYARNGTRSLREEYFVTIGLCTHLGCAPLFEPQPDDTRFSNKWIGGFFCPCHGSRFDLAGSVVRTVPAPTNLVIPPYKFVGSHRLENGTDYSDESGKRHDDI